MYIPFDIAPEVRSALEARRPVVALESVAISHGFPRPSNFAAALEFEQVLRDKGVTPATIAVLDGVVHIGLDRKQLLRLSEEAVFKASVRDLPVLAAKKASGATTIAATAYLAARAGIPVFAAEGLGGVHPQDEHPADESADMLTLAAAPITLVCSGIKSLLDVSATLERLDTMSVPVIGYRTHTFPRFWVSESEHRLDWRVDSPQEVAAIMRAQRDLGLPSGLFIANPVDPAHQLDPELHDRVIADALRSARAEGIVGKAVTPYIMDKVVAGTEGRSVQVNREMILGNVRLAAEIALAWSVSADPREQVAVPA